MTIKILAVMQNQWFKDPDRIRAILDHGLKRGLKRHDFIMRTLFMGCKSGRVLKSVFGETLCRRIIWEEASPNIGGHASSAFPADPSHLNAVLEEINPDIVLAFGRIASDALTLLVPKHMLIIGPHPTARGSDTLSRLNTMRDHLVNSLNG